MSFGWNVNAPIGGSKRIIQHFIWQAGLGMVQAPAKRDRQA